MIKKLKLTQYESIGGWETITVENLIKIAEKINEIIDTLSKPSVEPHKEPLSFNCTLAKFAEQLDVPLWKAMEFGKYFKPSVVSVQDLIKCADNALGYYGIGTKMTSKEIDKVFGAIHNLITKGENDNS